MYSKDLHCEACLMFFGGKCTLNTLNISLLI